MINHHTSLLSKSLHICKRFKWLLICVFFAVLAMTLALAQSTASNASGGTMSLTAQVVGPTGSTTLNSTYSVSSNDEVLFTTNITQPTSSPSNSEGKMTFPANFTWVSNSMLAPPNAEELKWNTGTPSSPVWVTPAPSDGTLVSELKWVIKPIKTLKLSPSTQGAVSFSGAGDGYRVFTYKNTGALNIAHKKDHLYVINHHSSSKYLSCRDALTGGLCPSYSAAGGKDVSSTLGTDLRNNQFTSNETPNRNIEHLRADGQVFFYVGNGNNQIRVLCADLNTLKSCADAASLGVSSAAKKDAVNPIGSVGDRFFAVSADSKIYCYHVIAKGMCTGYPIAAKYNNPSTTSTSMNLVMGEKLFYISNNLITCFDTVTNAHCSEPGWVNNFTTAMNKEGLFPVLETSGLPKGVCVQARCLQLNGDAFTPADHAAAYKTFLDSNLMFTASTKHGKTNGGYTQANYYGTRVFHTSSNDVNDNGAVSADLRNYATCFDFATNTVCPNFPITHADQEVRIYAITQDTVRSNCLWSIGDPSIAKSFDPRTGGDCTSSTNIPSVIDFEVDPKLSTQCDGSATPIRGWKALRFSPSLEWGPTKLIDMLVDIYSGTTKIGATRSFDKTNSDVSKRYQMDISDISYLTYPKLSFKLTPTVGSSGIDASVGFDVTWDGDPTQVCVKLKAPTLANCSSVSAASESKAVAVHILNPTPTDYDVLNASQSGTAGVIQSGLGPVANSTTLLQQPKGGSDPTQVLQTRFNMTNFSGDLYQYELLSLNTLSTLPISKASNEAVANRKYFTSDGASTGQPTLISLTWANLSTAQQAQLNQTKAGVVDALGSNRVAYVIGDRTKETTSAGGTFRARSGLLGPAIDSSPAILQNSILAGLSADKYPNYTNFKRNVARTNKLVFYNANDNYLHAYKVNTTGLAEAFSYMPSIALADVPRFTDSTPKEIAGKPYFMDNTPMVADVNLAATKAGDDWRSVVVANRGRGGRGVFALDVTGDKTKSNATQSKPDAVLFEYSNTTAAQSGEGSLADLGFNLGQPPNNKVTGADQIVRVRSGTGGSDARWAYITGNGVDGSVGKDGKACNLNNGPCSKKAVLYIFYLNGNLTTGARWKRIPVHTDAATAAGLDTELDFANGLSTPRPTDVNGDGVVDYVYAGDLKGNLWRFDLTDMSNVVVTKIFKTDDAQPIHTAPVLISASGAGTCTASASNTRACMMVVMATGQDTNPLKPLIASTKLQRLYGIFDKTDLTGTSALVTTDKLTAQTISSTTSAGTNGLTYRTVSSAAVDYVNGQRGWKIALPTNEHNTANPVMQSNGTVLFATTLPSTTAPTCSDGWLTQVNATTGSGLLPFAIGGVSASVKLPNSLEGVGSYSVPSSLGSGSLNSAQSSFITATLKGSASNVFTTTRELMLGRMSWREVFGAPKN